MQKVVINTLVYLVYGYYNSSTIKERDSSFLVISSFLVCWYVGIVVNGNFVYNVIRNIPSPNTYGSADTSLVRASTLRTLLLFVP